MSPCQLQDIVVTPVAGLHDHNDSGNIRLNMKLLGPAVNIDQQQVVQKKVLDKVILVKPLLIGNQQILNLERRHLSDDINILADTACHKYVFQLILVINFEILVSLNLLGIRRGSRKFHGCSCVVSHICRGGSRLTVNIQDTQIHAGNAF